MFTVPRKRKGEIKVITGIHENKHIYTFIHNFVTECMGVIYCGISVTSIANVRAYDVNHSLGDTLNGRSTPKDRFSYVLIEYYTACFKHQCNAMRPF